MRIEGLMRTFRRWQETEAGKRYSEAREAGLTPFGAAVRRIRKSHGLNQGEMSRVLGVSLGTVSKRETTPQRPTMEYAGKVALAFELPREEAIDLFRLAGLSGAYFQAKASDLSDKQAELTGYLGCLLSELTDDQADLLIHKLRAWAFEEGSES